MSPLCSQTIWPPATKALMLGSLMVRIWTFCVSSPGARISGAVASWTSASVLRVAQHALRRGGLGEQQAA